MIEELSPQKRAAITRKKNAELRANAELEVLNAPQTSIEGADVVELMKVDAGTVVTPELIIDNSGIIKAMNDLAMRIFEGQSPDLSTQVRTERIVMRLKNKGYTCLNDLQLPLDNYKRYI